jgi:hypothetical protein
MRRVKNGDAGIGNRAANLENEGAKLGFTPRFSALW